jgi:hypothetical protein
MGSAPAETRRISSARPRPAAANGEPETFSPETFSPETFRTARTFETSGISTLTRAAGTAGTAGTGMLPVLPVLPALRGLLPRGGLACGSVVTVAEFGLLALALLAAASAAGAWCGIAGIPEAGLLAAVDLGLDAERTLLVPDPGGAWPQVVASLIDGCELVLVRPPGQAPAQVRQRLEASLRRDRSVLLVAGDWPGAQVRLRVVTQGWTGLGDGHGRLRARCAEVVADGRGEAATTRTRWLWLPGEDGSVTVADPADILARGAWGDGEPPHKRRAPGGRSPGLAL